MSEVQDANRRLHAQVAPIYDQMQPHFRPENQAKVRTKLEELRARVPGGRLLDLGCGTGFIIRLAVGIFDEIHGVDITPEMMQRIDTAQGNIKLHLAPAEALPFGDREFDAVSAYGFIDLVADVSAVLREMARVLKPGGVAYIDLVPNSLFWKRLQALDAPDVENLSDIVERERRMVMHAPEDIRNKHGVDAEIFEHAKAGTLRSGIDHLAFERAALASGFSACETRFEWFLGQGAVMHGESADAAAAIDAYLQRVLPLARHLFKYLRFALTR